MAAPASTDEFVDLVRKSGVLEDKRIDSYVQQLRAKGELPHDPSKFAGLMVRDGYLTHFQAEQFMMGKWRRFTIGKYKVLERLGSGGMGSVYLCEHKFMRRRVAVKVLPAAKAEDPSSLERFYREARAAAALDHPNIVRAYDIDQDENLHFLVMEYVDGVSLQELIKKFGPLNMLRAAHYMRQSAVGLQHAHEAGLVHRDVKPGNVLIDRAGTVKVLDMGLARFFHDEEDILTKKYDESVLGTADYLAPEQALDSHGVDIRADIYSLGATFYFCLTGNPPFNEGTVAQKLIWHQTRQPKSIKQIRPEVPEGLVAIVEKMMTKDRTKRYQTPAQVVEALAAWTRQPIPAPPDVEMPRLSLAAMGGVMPETSTSAGTPTPHPAAAQQAARTQQVAAVARPVATSPPVARPTQPMPVRAPVAQHAPVRPTTPQPSRGSPGNGVPGSTNWSDLTAGAPPGARAPQRTGVRNPAVAPPGKSKRQLFLKISRGILASMQGILASMKKRPKIWLIAGGVILVVLMIWVVAAKMSGSQNKGFNLAPRIDRPALVCQVSDESTGFLVS